MFLQAVPGELKGHLEAIGKEARLEQFYLAGGTALALQLGHRISRDLDFFTGREFSERDLVPRLEPLGKLAVDAIEPGTLLGSINGIRISFFFYRYPLILPPVEFLGVSLAHLRDIGAMKLDAIQSRGRKRDFIDLWAILRHDVTLGDVFATFQQKYAGVDYSTLHLLKSLAYVADAEADPMPEMLADVSWEAVKAFLEVEVKQFSQNLHRL